MPHNARVTSPPTPPRLTKLLPRLPTWLHPADLQGLAQLATHGVLGAIRLAEKVQGNVYKAVAIPFGALGRPFVDATPGGSGVRRIGITGLGYGSVRGVARLAGGAANVVLAGALPFLRSRVSSPAREAMLSALNGVLGDQLADAGNPLAITMTLRHQSVPLDLRREALAQAFPGATGKIVVLLHGLCMNDLQWAPGADQSRCDYARLLTRERGYTPLFLHYNSGLHISANGQQLAALLEQLMAVWPQPVRELTLLAHSMGGLVARSACHQAGEAGLAWRARLKHIIFLGTPHHGAPLERVGSWVDALLGSNAVTRPFAKIGQLRSAGITDLRYGHLLQSDWQDIDRFERAPDARREVPLPAGVACYAVAGTDERLNPLEGEGLLPRAGTRLKAAARGVIGDGLVPVKSAFGQHDENHRSLQFPAENQWLAHGTHHMALLNSPAVGEQLLRWLD